MILSQDSCKIPIGIFSEKCNTMKKLWMLCCFPILKTEGILSNFLIYNIQLVRHCIWWMYNDEKWNKSNICVLLKVIFRILLVIFVSFFFIFWHYTLFKIQWLTSWMLYLSKLLKVPSVFRIGKQHNIHSFFIVLHFSENIPVSILQVSCETIKVLHFIVAHYGVNECIK